MRVYAAELICSTGVLGFHTLKLALCIHNKLRSHAEILSWWAFDVTFPGSNPLRSNRSGLNVSNGGSWNPKLTLKVNGLWIKMKGQNFASQVLSRHTFRISRKKGSDFFDHRGTLNRWPGHFQFPQLTILYSVTIKHNQTIDMFYLPPKVGHVFSLELAVGLREHRSPVF